MKTIWPWIWYYCVTLDPSYQYSICMDDIINRQISISSRNDAGLRGYPGEQEMKSESKDQRVA